MRKLYNRSIIMRFVIWLFTVFTFLFSLIIYNIARISGTAEIRVIWSVILSLIFCRLLYLTCIECIRFICFIIFLYKDKGCLRPWYDNLDLKQRIIIWCVTVLLSLIPIIGWFLISPWLIVLLYCEYKRPSKK